MKNDENNENHENHGGDLSCHEQLLILEELRIIAHFLHLLGATVNHQSSTKPHALAFGKKRIIVITICM